MNAEQFEKIVRDMHANGWTRTDIVAATSAVFAKINEEAIRRHYATKP